MLSSKNISTHQTAALSALLIAAIGTIITWFFTNNWQAAAITLGILFLIGYLIIHFFLQRFIYRKIKLIYKLINQTKASKKEEMYYKYLLPKTTIDEAEADVTNWALQRTNEIEILRRNEAFRKEFLQNLAHELKTPIFALQGYITTLLDTGVEDTTIANRFLQKAGNNVDRMVNLVNDLDEITRLESGEQPLSKENFVMQDLIREVYESLSHISEEKGIHFQFKKGTEQDISVFADKEKIRQVLINLLENAIKYGRQRGSIIASVYRTDGRHVLTEISDDGMGIAEEHLARIFERFYRTDTARSRKIGGSGLGLAICKHIIEAHGQSIHVRSKEDVGSTFGFMLESRGSV
jgi:two-component system, OmpR family, phosphate regulon sensor histidine kinase PhoR